MTYVSPTYDMKQFIAIHPHLRFLLSSSLPEVGFQTGGAAWSGQKGPNGGLSNNIRHSEKDLLYKQKICGMYFHLASIPTSLRIVMRRQDSMITIITMIMMIVMIMMIMMITMIVMMIIMFMMITHRTALSLSLSFEGLRLEVHGTIPTLWEYLL